MEKLIELQALAVKAAKLKKAAAAAGVSTFTRIDLGSGQVETLTWETRTSLRETLWNGYGPITEEEITRHLDKVAEIIQDQKAIYAAGIERMRAQVAAYDKEHGRA